MPSYVWMCECCGRRGTVEYPNDAEVLAVVLALEDAHAALSADCRFDPGRVRLRVPSVAELREELREGRRERL